VYDPIAGDREEARVGRVHHDVAAPHGNATVQLREANVMQAVLARQRAADLPVVVGARQVAAARTYVRAASAISPTTGRKWPSS